MPRDSIRNNDPSRSLRVLSATDYAGFWRIVPPILVAGAADPRLRLSPNFVAALLLKESGADSLAVSWQPAFGYAQLTVLADSDLRVMATAPSFRWMRDEAAAWPRAPVMHRLDISADRARSLLASHAVTSKTEYLFDPRTSTRGALFFLRLLAEKWTADQWPGEYGTMARAKLNGGRPLNEPQLFDLVTVSYNMGYLAVRDLVGRYGATWTAHLAEQGAKGREAADYVERVRAYAELLARGSPVTR